MKHHEFRAILPWLAADAAISLGSAILLAFVVARLIGPVAFGIAGTAYLLGGLAEACVSLPFADAVIQRRDLDRRTTDAAFAGMLGFGLLAFLAMVALAFPFARLFAVPELVPLIVAQGTTCLLLGLRGVPEALLSRAYAFRALAVRNILAKVASTIVAVSLATAGAGPWSIVLSNVAYGFASTALVLSIAGSVPRLRPDRAATVSLLRFGVFSLADGLLWQAIPRLFAFIVGHVQGMRALGLLSVGFRINDAVTFLLYAVTSRIALPIFSRRAEVPGQLEVAYQAGTKLTVMASTPIFVGLAFVSTEIVSLVLGPEWAPAAGALVAFNLFSVANYAQLLASPAIKAVGKPYLLIVLNLVGLVYVGTGALLTASHGFGAPLVVWTSFGFVYFVTAGLLLRRATGIGWRTQIEPLVRPSLAALGMALALLAVGRVVDGDPLVVAFSVKVAVGVVTYGLLLGLLERRFLFEAAGLRDTVNTEG